jgi:hypothetical protein
MKALHSIVILLTLLLYLPVSNASDGNELLGYCKSAIELFDAGHTKDESGASFCIGYVIAAKETLSVASMASTDLKIRACIPDGVTGVQGVRVVTKYLENNPEALHERMLTLTIVALREAFPCN